MDEYRKHFLGMSATHMDSCTKPVQPKPYQLLSMERGVGLTNSPLIRSLVINGISWERRMYPQINLIILQGKMTLLRLFEPHKLVLEGFFFLKNKDTELGGWGGWSVSGKSLRGRMNRITTYALLSSQRTSKKKMTILSKCSFIILGSSL